MITDFVVDANSLWARSWFAAQRISSDPKEALRLAVSTVLHLLNPNNDRLGVVFDRTLFAWDGQRNTAKNRSEKPAAYHETKAVLKEALEAMLGTVNVEHPEAEGDDIVATVVYGKREEDVVYIVSGDKDLMQLQGKNCHYYSLNEKAELSTSFIIHKFPAIKRPSQVALALAIVGDSVDSIKGISGYGPAKCKKLFEKVTPDMNFVAALKAVESQLTASRVEELYAALDRTLLKMDLSGIPKPKPLRLCRPELVDKLEIPQIGNLYREVYASLGA